MEKKHIPTLKYFSPSSLNTCLDCPRRFYYSKTKAPHIITKNVNRDFGSCIHLAIHDYYKKNQNTILEKDEIEKEILSLVRNRWRDYYLPKKEKKRDRVIREFVNFETTRIKNPKSIKMPIYTEIKLYSKDKRVNRHCIVDFYNNGVAIDWKTGRFEKFDRGMMIQGKYTEILLEENNHHVDHVLFVVLGEEQEMPMPFVDRKIVEDLEEKALEIIDTGEFNKNITWLCDYCDYNLLCFSDNDCLWCLK